MDLYMCFANKIKIFKKYWASIFHAAQMVATRQSQVNNKVFWRDLNTTNIQIWSDQLFHLLL